MNEPPFKSTDKVKVIENKKLTLDNNYFYYSIYEIK